MEKQYFDELAAKTSLKAASLRMAEAILVNGMSAAEAVERL